MNRQRILQQKGSNNSKTPSRTISLIENKYNGYENLLFRLQQAINNNNLQRIDLVKAGGEISEYRSCMNQPIKYS